MIEVTGVQAATLALTIDTQEYASEKQISATNLKRDIQQFQRVRKHTLSTISRKR